MKQHVWVEHKDERAIIESWDMSDEVEKCEVEIEESQYDPASTRDENWGISDEVEKGELVKDRAVTSNEAETSENVIHEKWKNDDKAKRKNATLADSEESTDTSADEEESDPDECLTTDKSENRSETKRGST